MIKAYSKFLDILEKLQRAILTVSVPAMVLIMFYQVVMRYVFHNSPAWSEELVRSGMPNTSAGLGLPMSVPYTCVPIGTLVVLNMADLPMLVLPQKLFAGMNSSSLLAIPFFILAGNLMSRSITGKLIDVANALIVYASKKGRILRQERYAGACSRSFFVGDVKPEDIKAKYESGILTVLVPKESVRKLPTSTSISIE